jgi:hypothetical protein
MPVHQPGCRQKEGEAGAAGFHRIIVRSMLRQLLKPQRE